jgi:hypothetical protein
MILGYDHAIFLVTAPDGLDAAARRFGELGFTITDRDDEGKDSAATAQKLICFEDGSYIELLAIRDPQARSRHRFAPFFEKGDGWADTSVHTDDLAGVQARLAAANLPVSGPHQHARRLRSGEPWGVALILPGIGAGHPALPFVIEDIEGRDLRIPRHGTHHANGVTGTVGVSTSVHDLEAARSGFEALFGQPIAAGTRLHDCVRSLRYAVGPHWLDVLERPDAGEGMISLALKRPGMTGTEWLATGRNAIALVSG